jgi:hypothetical protein
MAGSTPWLRPACTWVTIFREPVSRLLSAYFYCHHSRGDPLCGSTAFNFSTVFNFSNAGSSGSSAHVAAFARHWGSFGFREMLLHPALQPAALSSAPRDTRPVWWAWKQVIDRLAPSSLSRAFASLRGMLDGGQMFDVVGVVERFGDTCRLLDALLPLPRGEPGRPAYRTYLAAGTALRVSHHSEDWKRAEEAARTAAIADPAVRASLMWDLRLHGEVVLPLFERQVRAAGLAS